MNLSVDVGVLLGGVVVQTTNNRGFTPEEIAERALDKIIYVGKDSHPAIVEQANAFKDAIRSVLVFYLREAQKSERTTICANLEKHGHADLSRIIRSM